VYTDCATSLVDVNGEAVVLVDRAASHVESSVKLLSKVSNCGRLACAAKIVHMNYYKDTGLDKETLIGGGDFEALVFY
jgi:hypothetical protein